MTPLALARLLVTRGLQNVFYTYRPNADVIGAWGTTKDGRVGKVFLTGLQLVQHGPRKLKRLANKAIDRSLA